MINYISKFNDLSNTKGYRILFFLIGGGVFTLSYLVQIAKDKPCNSLLGEIIRPLHHLCIYFSR